MRRMPALFLAAMLGLPLSPLAAEPVNINTADAATLADAINGIGLARAEAIVAYRQEHGPFKSVDDLAAVKGVGDKTIEKNRDRLTVSSPQ